eukprot:NODE_5151_length_609_cov_2.153430.p3 GENE.NODE_5151_length_609_cov_2.153430~~NODE_5151_length_609_cov_2.153430.p3  ORF type:complete len:67 (-),score=2.82 NODE_5151_length_609_cov_2.153430:298-498(-)
MSWESEHSREHEHSHPYLLLQKSKSITPTDTIRTERGADIARRRVDAETGMQAARAARKWTAELHW